MDSSTQEQTSSHLWAFLLLSHINVMPGIFTYLRMIIAKFLSFKSYQKLALQRRFDRYRIKLTDFLHKYGQYITCTQ